MYHSVQIDVIEYLFPDAEKISSDISSLPLFFFKFQTQLWALNQTQKKENAALKVL